MKDRLLTILVTGAESQLGNELKVLNPSFPYCQFLFTSKKDLPIDNYQAVTHFFSGHSIDYCVNCAAYTAVDKAETEKNQAFLINAEAVGNLAKLCHQNKTQLIHISTDYVFDGTADSPYKETDKTNAVSVYGKSKLLGEELAMQHCPSSIIIRTSWLYSAYKSNFVKTMVRLMNEKESIGVVNDQTGCPTYAADLALAIMRIIKSGRSWENPGIFHYCNAGITTWHGFAVAIKKLIDSSCIVNPISTAEYITAAGRPGYSVLDCSKIKKAYNNIETPPWKVSLQKCLSLLNKKATQ